MANQKETNRLLIVATSADQYTKVGRRTGLWLSELTHFYDVAEDAGYELDIASPKGGTVPLDPMSLMLSDATQKMGLDNAVAKRYADRAFMDRLNASLKLSDVRADDYDAIYIAGGHGAMFDLPESTELANLLQAFAAAGKVVSAVCHGPAGLLEAKGLDGEFLVKGKEVTAFSWVEEELVQLDEAVPFNLEEELDRRGANYSKAAMPGGAHVVSDSGLVTGQNPLSSTGVAESVIHQLRETRQQTGT